MQNYINYTDKNEVYDRTTYLLEFILTMKKNGDIIKKDYKKNKKILNRILKVCRKDDSSIIEYCEDVFYIKRKLDKIYEIIERNMNTFYTFKKL